MKKSVFAIVALTAAALAGPLLAQTPAKPAAPAAMMAALIDINSASKAQLSSLKGIGDARSDAREREQPGRSHVRMRCQVGT